jgi:hypothetical protein
VAFKQAKNLSFTHQSMHLQTGKNLQALPLKSMHLEHAKLQALHLESIRLEQVKLQALHIKES